MIATPPAWEAVILGRAQDGGVPHMGCRCPRCTAARDGSRPREKAACLGLTDGERAYVVDATPDLPAQVEALSGGRLDGVFLTHAHVGHYTGLVHLGKEVMGARGVPVHCTGRMSDFLAGNAPWSALVEGGHVILQPCAEVHLRGLTLRAIPVPHRDEFSDTVAYLVKGPQARLLYLPDIDSWEAWDRDVREIVGSVDHALLDGTFLGDDELPGRDMSQVPHPRVTDTMARLEGLGAKVRFTHLNHTNPLLDDPAPAEAAGFSVAREGDRIPL